MKVMELEKQMSTMASTDNVCLSCRCTVLDDAVKSSLGSTNTGLMGKIYAQAVLDKVYVIVGLVKHSWDELKHD